MEKQNAINHGRKTNSKTFCIFHAFPFSWTPHVEPRCLGIDCIAQAHDVAMGIETILQW